jgi:hypothetical protein
VLRRALEPAEAEVVAGSALDAALSALAARMEGVPGASCAAPMTLDDAIHHAEQRAAGTSPCADQHAQLVAWLKELRVRRASSP